MILSIIDAIKNAIDKRNDRKEEQRLDGLGYPSKLTQKEIIEQMQNPTIFLVKAKHFAFRDSLIEFSIQENFQKNIFDDHNYHILNSQIRLLGSFDSNENRLVVIDNSMWLSLDDFQNLAVEGLENVTSIGVQKSYRWYKISKNEIAMIVWFGFRVYSIFYSKSDGTELADDEIQNAKNLLRKVERTMECPEFVLLPSYVESELLRVSYTYIRCFGGIYYNYIVDFINSYNCSAITKKILKKLHIAFKTATSNSKCKDIKLRHTYSFDIYNAKEMLEDYLQ